MNGLKNGLQEGLISGLNNGLADGLTNGLTNGLYLNEYLLDNDAYKFLVATNIHDALIVNRINNLVIYLKSFGLWQKMKAIYPFVGNTANSQKYNLKDPRDLDIAFRLSFFGGWTHSATGAKPNGTNAYADTFLNSSTILTATSAHLSYYSRTTTVGGNAIEIGNLNSLSGSIILHLRTAANFVAGSTSSVTSFTTTGSALGFWLGSKRSNSDRETYLNGTTQTTVTTSDTTVFNNLNIYLGASNVAGTANLYSAKECAFATIGDGLTDADAINFYNIVQDFQRGLNRAV